MLTRKTKYALKALLVLADEGRDKPLLIADLAERAAVPRKFLEAILLEINKAGLLHSRKGRGGGYWLAKEPRDITVGEIIRLTDGPLAPVPCVSVTAYAPCTECKDEETCRIRSVMKEARDALASVLDRRSLADMMRSRGVRSVISMDYVD